MSSSTGTPAGTVAAGGAGSQGGEILSPLQLAWRSFRRRKLGLFGTAIVIVLAVVAAGGSIITPYEPNGMGAGPSLAPPSFAHLAGTDRFGRDQLSRLMAGTQISMLVSFGSVLLSLVIGLPLGLLAGYYGGRIDSLIMRSEDVIFAFPTLLLALMMVATMGANLFNLVIAIAIIFQANVVRIVRASVMSVKEKEYVEAARAVAARDVTIMGRFILPNVLSPVIVQATFHLSLAIFIEASLSFIGMGSQPPTPSWGLMLNESRTFMETAPWLTVFPGLAIVIAVLGFNLMGDGLRDALDPRLSER